MNTEFNKVSIIIPVYNAEQAIGKCIESVLVQDYENLEIILVDDGSSDSSYEILQQYAEKDARIRFFHKENSGVSETRNFALSKASGQYIQFIDADDYLPADSTKSLVRAIEENDVDLVVADFYRVSGSLLSRKGKIDVDTVLSRNEYAEYMSDSPADYYYYGVLWNKLYKASIIREFNLKMDPALSFCEDVIFNLEYLLHCKTVYPLQIPVYYYINTEGSLVAQNISFSKIYNMKTNVFRYYDSFFKEILDEEEYRNERLQINKFLVTFATDGYVFPFSPRTKSVGKEFGNGYLEHINISDITTTTYYLHRSYDRYLNTVAAKNNLELNDVKIFDLIRRSNHDILLRDIVEYTGISLPTLLISLEKLASRDYISFKMFPSAELSVNINSQTEIFIKDIDRAISDLYEVCTKGLSNDEISVLESLIKTLNSNMTEFLKNSIPANHKNRAS